MERLQTTYTTKSPSPPRASETFSPLRWCHIPLDPAGSEFTDSEWARKGIRVCAQESVSILQIQGKVTCVFLRIPTKSLFFSPPSKSFHVPNLSGCAGPWKNIARLCFWSLTIPTSRDSLPTSSFPDLWESIVERHSIIHSHTRTRAGGVVTVRPGSRRTYLRKYLWPVAVKVISQPGGSGSSSVTS